MPTEPGSDTGGLIDDLTRWLAEARVDAAASSRARERWLRQQLESEATVAGVLLDLAEGGSTVVLQGAAGRRRGGAVTAVADDFCVLRAPDRRQSLHVYDAITAIVPLGSSAPAAGGRPATLDMTFAEALAVLAEERRRVLLVSRSADVLSGELRSVGRDVLVLRPEGQPRASYVPIATVAEVALAD
jgi:hypothetical protein